MAHPGYRIPHRYPCSCMDIARMNASTSPGFSPGLLLQYIFRSNADHVVHALDKVVTVVTLYTWMHRAALGLSGPVVHEKTHLHRSHSF